MVDFRNFLKLKNILSRLNPIPSFRFGDEDESIRKPPSQEELLESVIKKYSQFNIVVQEFSGFFKSGMNCTFKV